MEAEEVTTLTIVTNQCQLCGKFRYLLTRCWYRFAHSFNGITFQSQSQVNNIRQTDNVEFYMSLEVQENFSSGPLHQQQFQPQQAQQ